MTHFLVREPGASTTVQDAGRLAWQHLGVSPAGFADPLLALLGNALVGNPPAAAVLECTLRGDVLQVVGGPLRVAVAAWADVRVDGQPAPCFRALRLTDGQVLSVGALAVGRHGVLAVAGGLQTAVVLGSRSVHARTGVGGRPLQAGDRVPLLADPQPDAPARCLSPQRVPPPARLLRVLAGPQPEAFAPDALARLVAGSWRVVASDRMGLRVERLDARDPPVRPRAEFEPISEGVVTGALQVPPSGQAILLGPDRQTVGGYAKIAVVISADLRHLAQLGEGQTVDFRLVDQPAAERAQRDADTERAQLLAAIVDAYDPLPCESPRLLRLLGHT